MRVHPTKFSPFSRGLVGEEGDGCGVRGKVGQHTWARVIACDPRSAWGGKTKCLEGKLLSISAFLERDRVSAFEAET